MTKLCSYCGKEIPHTSKICPYCNRPLMEDVLTYRVEEKRKSNVYSSRKSSDFSTNIYSVSNDEIDRIFEKKLPDKPVNHQRPVNKTRYNRNQNKKQNNDNGALSVILIVIIVILAAILSFAVFWNNDTKSIENTTSTTTSTTTTAPQTSTTVQTTPSTSTTQKATISASSTDLYGYLGVKFESVNTHFGNQIKNSTVDEFYGGNVYYFDGLTITTVQSGVIVSVTMDYSSCSDADKYRFKDLFHASSYDDVIAIMGTPDNDQLGTSAEPCISYVLDIGSGQSVKFFFDEENRLKKFDLFYAD